MEHDVYYKPEEHVHRINGWGTSIEHVYREASLPPQVLDVDIEVEEGTQFLLAVISTPDLRPGPWLRAELEIVHPSESKYYGSNAYESPVFGENDSDFLSGRLMIANQPAPGKWNINADHGDQHWLPYALNVLAHNPSKNYRKERIRCKGCKITAKALGVAIVTAATLPALPTGLIVAVADYLGVITPVAATFIYSIVDSTASEIAEALCQKVGFC